MDADARRTYDALDVLLSATAWLPAESLTAQERAALAGQLFSEADELVCAVAGALGEDPVAFCDVTLCPKDLLARQERARAYRALHESLKVLCARAGDAFLRTQAQVATDAMDVVRYARAGRTRFPGPQQRAREDALLRAEALLRARHQRKRSRRGVVP